jgi:acetyltransferase
VTDEHGAKGWLERAGLRVPRRRACTSRAEAHAALSDLGPPVVVKVLDPTVTHKSDVSGVHLGVASPDDLERALDAIDAIEPAGGTAADTGGGAGRLRRYLVEETVEAGVELLVGARRDPSFGPIVALGLGGVLTEALGDVAVRLVPVSMGQAAAMADELAGRALLDGARGLAAVDRDELAGVLVALGARLLAHDEIAEIEVNPLIATAGGLIVADALVVLA